MTARPTRHLTTEQVAERYGVPVRTVERWRATGTGPKYLEVGKYRRYRETDLDAWDKARLRDPAA